MITLSEAEQRLAKFLAKSRYENARKKNIKNNRIGSQSDSSTDLEGIAAEIAFCKLFNLYPDLQIGELPAYDAMLRDGRAVDVKATKYQSGHVTAVMNKKDMPADLYALMVGTFPSYRFAGFCRGDELMASIKDLGHGPTHAISQDKLRATA